MSVRSKVYVIIIIVIVIVTAASFLTSFAFAGRSLSVATERDLSFAIDVADGLVSNKIQLLKANAGAMAERLQRVASDDELPEILRNYLITYAECSALTVFDRDGIVSSYGAPISPQELADHSEWIEMAFGGKTIITSPFYCAGTDDFVIHIYTPAGEDRVLSQTISGLIFCDLISEYRLWNTGNIFMLDSEGTIIADVDRELVLERRNFIRDLQENPGQADEEGRQIAGFYQDMLSTYKGVGTYTYQGVERICSFTHITDSLTGWRVAVSAPLRESSLSNVRQILIWTALLFLVIWAAISIAISAIIVRPYKELESIHETVKTDNTRMQALLYAMPFACTLWNKDLKIFDCNGAAVRLLGAKDKKDLTEHFYDFSPEYQADGRLSADVSEEDIRRAFAEGSAFSEWTHRTLSGELVPTEVFLVRISYGGEDAVAAYVRDMSEQVKSMDTLKQRDNLLGAVCNATTVLLTAENDETFESSIIAGMEIIGRCVDADCVEIWRNEMRDGELHAILRHYWLSEKRLQTNSGSIVRDLTYSVSPGWEERLSRGELISGPLSELSPEDQEFLKSIEYKSLLAIPVVINERFWGFFAVNDTSKERHLPDEELQILRSGALMIVSAIDRYDQASDIREAHENASLLLDSTPLSCRLWSRDFQIFACNEESLKLFNVGDKQELMDRYFDLSPEYQPDGSLSDARTIEMLKRALDGEKIVFEWMYRSSDGTPIPAEVTLVRVPYNGDYAVAGYSRDLREQKEMMRRIQEAVVKAENANSAKSDFLSKMSHEMRTPLNAVLVLSGLSLENDDLAEETRSNLEKIYNSGSTLLSTVNDILDISKIEAGRLELVPIDYDVPSLINDSITQNILRIGEKPLEFKLDICRDLYACLHGDELRVKQIINNLLSNAIKYSEEGTVILRLHCTNPCDGSIADHCLASAEDGTVGIVIQVEDTGRGIRHEDLASLFSDYVTFEDVPNQRVEGTGLGLPITKSLAEMMGGSISVESEYGKGSIFTVIIKQKCVSDTRIGQEVADNLANFSYSDKKRNRITQINRVRLPDAHVLVVDDNVTNLDVAKGLLKLYGMQIDCVTSGQQAINAIRNREIKYNAIFMDHMMPGMDGLEAVSLIRKLGSDYAENIPIIALTANAVVGNEEMFLKNGFQAFLSKPINIMRLDEVIRHWVGNADREKEFLSSQIAPDEIDADIFDKIKIRGLYTQDGLDQFGGDAESYLAILRSYAVNTKPLLDKAAAVTEETLADYAITVHGVKGSSRSIGARPAGDFAEDLEHAAKEGNFKFIEDNNESFINFIRTLIRDIERVLEIFGADEL